MTTISRPTPPDILSPEHARDPYATYRVLLEHYPVLFHERTQSWIVTRHADLWGLLRDGRVNAENYTWQTQPTHGRTILNMDGREHTAHRKLLNGFFHGGGLERFHPEMVRSARALADVFLEREAAAVRRGERERGQVDIVSEFTRPFPMDVVLEMLDLPKSDREIFLQWAVSLMEYLSNLDGSQEKIDDGLRTREEIANYVLPLIEARRGGDAEDLISMLCSAEVDGERLTDDNVRAFVSLLLSAAAETTDHSIASIFSNLLQHPDQLAAVYEDHSLIDDAFAETLRYSPAVHMITRQAKEDLELQGETIPAGATITCLLAAANRDPRKFADPDRFDIFRTDNNTERAFRASADHLSFANGRHFCVGAMLARAEVQVGTALLLDNMKDLRLRDGVIPVEGGTCNGVFQRGPVRVEVTYLPA